MPGGVETLLWMLGAGLVVALVAGVPVLALALWLRPARWFPPFRRWSVPWGGSEVLACFVLAFLMIPAFVLAGLAQGGLFTRLYGPDFPPLPAEGAEPTPEQRSASALRQLWAAVLGFPFEVAAVLAVLHYLSGARPADAGVTGKRWPQNVVVGYFGWLVLTPLTFGVFAAAVVLLHLLTGAEPEKHPLTLLGPGAGSLEWTLFALQVVLTGPFIEELLFRGVLLPWLLSRRLRTKQAGPLALVRRADICVALAFAISLLMHERGVIDGVRAQNWGEAFRSLLPALFVLLLLPLYVGLPCWRWLGRRLRLRSGRAGRGVIGSAALFAAVHANVWPSPVPLFVLALGLGCLAARTRSLVAPVVVHGLFNGVSAVYLLLGGEA